MNSDRFQKCIQLCISCAIECQKCAAACLHENDFEMLKHCIAFDRDCSALCEAAVSAMRNNNPLADRVCDVCADMCDACADECEKHHHHEHCNNCAKICRKCAAECRNCSTAETIV